MTAIYETFIWNMIQIEQKIRTEGNHKRSPGPDRISYTGVSATDLPKEIT